MDQKTIRLVVLSLSAAGFTATMWMGILMFNGKEPSAGLAAVASGAISAMAGILAPKADCKYPHPDHPKGEG